MFDYPEINQTCQENRKLHTYNTLKNTSQTKRNANHFTRASWNIGAKNYIQGLIEAFR
jgi:hypothetical protein